MQSCETNDLFEQQKVIKGHVRVPYKTTKLNYKGVIVKGNFDCSGTDIHSLEGAPREVDGWFYCHSTDISSLEGAPEKVRGGFACSYTCILSIHNIHKQIKYIGDELLLPSTLKSHILGVLFIEGLNQITIVHRDEQQEQVQAIINNHLAGDRDIHLAQEELLEAGLKEYAKL